MGMAKACTAFWEAWTVQDVGFERARKIGTDAKEHEKRRQKQDKRSKT